MPVYHVRSSDQYSRLTSALAGSLGALYLPPFLRRPLFGLYCRVYAVDQQEMVQPLESYDSFLSFFTRKVKPRDIDQRPNVLVSPADSRVLSFGEVH